MPTTKTNPIYMYREQSLEERIADMLIIFARMPELETATPADRQHIAEAVAINIINIINKELLVYNEDLN